jgi:hypothetical protein
MNLGGLLILTGFNTALVLLVFRVESKHRRIVAACVLIGLFMVYQYGLGNRAESEAIFALVLAVIFNFVFWVLIGRYNPPRSDDEIKVIGLDD